MKGQGRSWKLKRMTIDSDDAMQLKKGQQAQADRRQQDLERFMQVSTSLFSSTHILFYFIWHHVKHHFKHHVKHHVKHQV